MKVVDKRIPNYAKIKADKLTEKLGPDYYYKFESWIGYYIYRTKDKKELGVYRDHNYGGIYIGPLPEPKYIVHFQYYPSNCSQEEAIIVSEKLGVEEIHILGYL
ncbi:MAG: hypothetical protein ACHQ1D_00395 [Nitrososphaerales archaeon]